MSIYTLPFASKEPYSALLPLALSTDNLSDNLVLITLDWERPWGFLEELKDWLESLRSLVDKVKREKGGEFTVQEGYDSGASGFPSNAWVSIGKIETTVAHCWTTSQQSSASFARTPNQCSARRPVRASHSPRLLPMTTRLRFQKVHWASI